MGLMDEMSWASLHSEGKSVYRVVAKVLRGEGTLEEEYFVSVKCKPETLLGVGLVELAKSIREKL